VRKLAEHYRTPPDRLSEKQVREYLLFLKNEKHLAASSLNIAACGLQFFFRRVAPRDWPTLNNLRIPRPKTLPDVLTVEEVRRLVDAVRTPHNKAYLWTVYSLGLRLTEGLHLQVVHSQAVGDGRASLKYLAPYVFRVAISDRRIISCDDGQVTFSYRKSGTSHWRKMTLEAHEFLRRFLQHVLPRGFQKARHYGFFSPNSERSLDAVRWLIALCYSRVFVLLGRAAASPPPLPPRRCPVCGGALVVIGLTLPGRSYFDTS
jgi:integrase